MDQPVKRGPGRPPKRGEPKRAPFQTRIRESLRARLEEMAAAHGRSLSEEIEQRLEDSFIGLEARFGGKAALNVAVMLFACFEFVGQQEAALKGHPEWTVAEWIADKECFEAALAQLIRSTWEHHPPPVSKRDLYEWLKDEALLEAARLQSGFVAPEAPAQADAA
jgi:hypothetical protein